MHERDRIAFHWGLCTLNSYVYRPYHSSDFEYCLVDDYILDSERKW